MRFSTNGLDAQYTYPCSKAGVKAAFGDGLLDSVCFGLFPEYQFSSRNSPKPKILGRAIMGLAVYPPNLTSHSDRASLNIYRVRKDEFNDLTHQAVADLMNGPMRHWLDAHLNRPETEVFGLDKLIIELRDGQLLQHETRIR